MSPRFYREVDEALRRAGFVWPGGPSNMRLCRTMAGRHQMAAGALSWYLAAVDGSFFGPRHVGSWRPARELEGRRLVAVLSECVIELDESP